MGKKLMAVVCAVLGVSTLSAARGATAQTAEKQTVIKAACGTAPLLKAVSKANKAQGWVTLSLAENCVYKLDKVDKTKTAGITFNRAAGLTVKGNHATLRAKEGVAIALALVRVRGAVTIEDLTISHNKAVGLAVTGKGVTLRRVHITQNSGGTGGTGITVEPDSSLIASDTTMDHNHGGVDSFSGGGMWIMKGGEATLTGSTAVKDNTDVGAHRRNQGGSIYEGGNGGGILNEGTLTLTDTASVSGNTSQTGPGKPEGKIILVDSGRGGGIMNRGTLTLRGHATVTGNTSKAVDGALGGEGGGVYNTGTLNLHDQATITRNTPTNCVSTTALPHCSA
ncbi:right-handed parallel beta-helix repeat-containing protein [Streptomyces sp. NPDC058401]|uniref:right-handed parallel beta-helix repeat-containing protein n=1 Tax=Streptomyces sp. NPDC058401 TaxID=3346480 RepID=UPI0036511765